MRTPSTPACAGFTRLDLLATALTLLLLAAVCRPVWGNHQSPQSLVCMDNLRRLASAWQMYADDYRGQFVRNPASGESMTPQPGRLGWVSGWLDWTTAPANTNTSYLTDPRASLLAPYSGPDATIFKCPADTYLSAAQTARGWTARVRSYSMNYFVGSGSSQTGFFPEYLIYNRLADFQKLAPGQVLLMVEEHPDSINDPIFITSMSSPAWMDLPASFHNGAAWFPFTDGHVEYRVWQSARTIVPVRFNYMSPALPPNDPDYLWVKSRTTERR